MYGDGSGYSNYTWEETYARCALSLNPKLEADCELPFERYDRDADILMPTWEPIRDTRCERYVEGNGLIVLDPDRECWPREHCGAWDALPFEDEEQYLAIWEGGYYGDPMPFEAYMKGHV